MKHQNYFFKNSSFLFLMMTLFGLLFQSSLQAQHGPTLIIASNLNGSYSGSKLGGFAINPQPIPPTDSYVLIKVGNDVDLIPPSVNENGVPSGGYLSWQYLDEAIEFFLNLNYQRIIILEGAYYVDGPIELNRLVAEPGTSDPDDLGRGKITIEGEGYGTQIINSSNYLNGPIFSVRSYYNTIKNMSIISDTYNINGVNFTGRNTCIELLANQSGIKVSNNVFENLYLGAGGASFVGNTAPPKADVIALPVPIGTNTYKYVVNNDGSLLDSQGINNRTGIEINATSESVENNIFKNISFHVLDKGIVLNSASTHKANNNNFENLYFDDVIVGIDFSSNVNAWGNVFSKIAMQTSQYTINLLRNVKGTNNYFDNIYQSDWNAGGGGNLQSTTVPGGTTINSGDFIRMIKLSTGSIHTTIANSEIAINSTQFFSGEESTHTQFINCFNSGNGGELDYKIGSNTTDDSRINLLGRVVIGTNSPSINSYDSTYNLIVNGKIRVKDEVYVKNAGITWPDYVFAKDYKLMTLQEVEQHIKDKGYLPNMPSAAEVEEQGIAVGDLIKRQQEKIEELTLYLIDMNKEIEAIKNNQKK